MDVIRTARWLATFLLASFTLVCIASAIAYGNVTEDDATVAEKYVNMEEAPSTGQVNLIAQVVDIPINDEQVVRVGLTEEYLNVNYTNLNTDAEISVIETYDMDFDIQGIVDNLDVAREEIRIEEEQAKLEEAKKQLKSRSYSLTQNQGGLVDIEEPSQSYKGQVIEVTGKDRDILERLVMGEAGNQGFTGAALVAQCIRDMYILGGFDSVEAVRTNCGYSGKLDTEPNRDVLDAVSFIFDEGGYAVKHRLLYFYAPKYSQGKFHNTQNLIIEYGGHRFFDRWN